MKATIFFLLITTISFSQAIYSSNTKADIEALENGIFYSSYRE